MTKKANKKVEEVKNIEEVAQEEIELKTPEQALDLIGKSLIMEIEEADEKIAETKKVIDSMSNELAEIEKKITSLESDINGNIKAAESLKSTMDEIDIEEAKKPLQEKIEGIYKEISENNEELKSIKESFQQNRTKLIESNNMINTISLMRETLLSFGIKYGLIEFNNPNELK